jgi:hypothetical protein
MMAKRFSLCGQLKMKCISSSISSKAEWGQNLSSRGRYNPRDDPG